MAEEQGKPLSLEQLRERYIELEIEAARIDREYRNLSYDRSQLLLRGEDLQKRLWEFERFERQIRNLEQDRSEISPLALGKMIGHEEEIMRVKAEEKKAAKSLKDDHGATPEEIPGKWRETSLQAAELEKQIQRLPDIDKLREQQQEIGREYQVVWKREAGEEGPDSGKERAGRETTLTDRMAAARAESELRKLTEPERGKERQPDHSHGRER